MPGVRVCFGEQLCLMTRAEIDQLKLSNTSAVLDPEMLVFSHMRTQTHEQT